MALFRNNICLKALVVAAGLSAGLPAAGLAAEAKPLELADTTATQIEELVRPALNAKDSKKAIQGIDTILAKIPRDSYDETVLNQMKASSCLDINDLHGALTALERSLEIADVHPNYVSEQQKHEILWVVAQINLQEASASKDPKQVAQLYARADGQIEQWIKNTKTFTPNHLQFIATLYYSEAQSDAEAPGGGQKVNVAMLEKALLWTDKGLRSAVQPPETFYQLKLAELFQLSRLSEAAELLELLVKKHPESQIFWQQLASVYLQLASTAVENHDDEASFNYNVRAILTIERAQKVGQMNNPKDNYNLVTIYFTIGQFSEACALLERDLKDGSIEPTRQNYELLANSYQQLHGELEASIAQPH